MCPFIDSHCHMPMRPVPNGCGAVLNAITEEDWGTIIDMATKLDAAYGAIGIHPWHVDTVRDGWDVRLASALRTNPKIMIGEIGIDANRPHLDAQRDIFVRQLKLAADFKRVAHIHWVGAWNILPEVLAVHNTPFVMHGFAGSSDIMRALLQKYDVYFSVGAGILNPARNRLQRAVEQMPVDKILVESDMDNSVDIATIISAIATLQGIPPQDMATIIYNNSKRMLSDG